MKIIAKPIYVVIVGMIIAITLFNIANYVVEHKVVFISEEVNAQQNQ